ncbi:MAG TPA: hypothetical protein VIN08_20670, partial [Ohtaekwangia sp.]|uniref:hypothetical protein n=1 Tax=Ohtaekwangia sp. TaxID=2066019 RepID=UPI002F92B14D
FIATYIGFVPSKEFRKQGECGLEQIAQKTKEHGKVAWISDLRRSEIFTDEDVTWANEYWNTNAYTHGLQYCALVVPESTFAAINVEEFIEEHERRQDALIIQLFSDIESAEEWCKEMLAL